MKVHVTCGIAAGALAGAEDGADTTSAGDESFHSCDEGKTANVSATDAETGKVGEAESPGAGMTRDNLIKMGFSEEEADWAVQQAKDQGIDASDDDAPAANTPVKTVVEKVVEALEEKVEVASLPAKEAEVQVAVAVPPPTKEEVVAASPTKKVEQEKSEVEEAEVVPAATSLAKEAVAEAEVAKEEKSTPVQASPPAKTVVNSPPAKSSSIKAPADGTVTKCIRKAGCTCVDCAGMSGLSLAPPADTECIRKAGCTYTDCADMAALTQPTGSPAEETVVEQEEPALEEQQVGTINLRIINQDAGAETPLRLVDLVSPAKEEEVKDEAGDEVEKPAVPVQGSPPAEAVKQLPAGAAIKCIRRDGCTSADCGDAGLTLATATSPAKETEEKEEAANEQSQEPEQEAAPSPAVQKPEMEEQSVEEPLAVQSPTKEAVAEADEPVAPVQASSPAKAVVNSPPAKSSAIKAQAAGVMTTCIRKAGCTCVDCAAMAGLTLPTSSPATEETEDTQNESEQTAAAETAPMKTPAKTGVTSAQKSTLNKSSSKSAKKSVVTPKASPAPAKPAPASAAKASPAPATTKTPAVKATGYTVKASPAAGAAKCIRREGCTCVDCSEMSGLSLKPSADAGSAIQCIRKADCVCPDCAEVEGLTLATASPAKDDMTEEPAAEAEPEDVVEPSAAKDVVAPTSPAKEQVMEEQADVEESAPAVEEPAAPVQASPPAKAGTVKASPAGAVTECIRRAGCTCPVCADMSGLSLAPAADTATVIKCIRRAGCKCAECADMASLTLASAPPAASPDKESEEVAAETQVTVEEEKVEVAPSPVKDAGVTVLAISPKREPVSEPEKPEAAAAQSAVKEAPASPTAAAVKCIRKAGCTCADCAEMSGLAVTSAPAAAEGKCIRKAGCKCADCAQMAGLSIAAGLAQDDAAGPRSPSAAAPSSAKKSAVKCAVKTVSVKQSPALKAAPEFRAIASPAVVGSNDSGSFSPEGFDNDQAALDMLEDDELELDDFTDMRISAVNEAMRAEMKAALAQHEAATKPPAPSDWDVKITEEGKAAAAAPAPASANAGAARYTLEDVERISSFNMDALKRRMEVEILELKLPVQLTI